jgi:hypothetical protein
VETSFPVQQIKGVVVYASPVLEEMAKERRDIGSL